METAVTRFSGLYSYAFLKYSRLLFSTNRNLCLLLKSTQMADTYKNLQVKIDNQYKSAYPTYPRSNSES